jgi:hypothetical protein
MTRVASWDIGYRDLVVCLATVVQGTDRPLLDDETIEWHQLDLHCTSYVKCIPSLIEQFKALEDRLAACSVHIIESQQGSRGRGLIVVSHVIHALTLHQWPTATVLFIPSHRKFDTFQNVFGAWPHDVTGVKSSSGQYLRRKKNSIWLTEQLLGTHHPKTVERFQAAPDHLKADIADALGLLACWAARGQRATRRRTIKKSDASE